MKLKNEAVFQLHIDSTICLLSYISIVFHRKYSSYDVENDETLKTLTLAYNFMGNDYFEPYVINDSTSKL